MSNKDLKYKNKYLKYKNKYLDLQSQIGGSVSFGTSVLNTLGFRNPRMNLKPTATLSYLPEDLKLKISSITGTNDSFKSMVDNDISTVLDDFTFESLKKKLKLDKSKKKEDMFLSPIYVYHPEYLEKREILMLAKIFIDNINKPKMINLIEYKKKLSDSLPGTSYTNLDRFGYNGRIPLSFNLDKLKNFLLFYTNISEPLELIFEFEKEFYVDDKQLDFELFFIFICILIKYNQLKLQQIPIIKIDLKNIDLVLFKTSFNGIIFGLNQNIIKKLSLHSNKIDEEQAIQLATAITNTKLIELCFFSMIINNKVCEALAAALKTNTTLTTLVLNYNTITDKTVDVLTNALKKNKILQILNLSGNKIGLKGAIKLAEVLQHTIITELTLVDTSIGDEGAKALANTLKDTKIKIIKLSNNYIGDLGATALATALTNSKLEILILKKNNIKDTGASALAKALETNTTLTILDLQWNMFRDIGAKALSDALASNPTLTELYLDNVISPTILTTIQDKLNLNKLIVDSARI